MTKSLRSTWQHIGNRNWLEIKSNWLNWMPVFDGITKPDPGLDKLPSLQNVIGLNKQISTIPDVNGLRANVFSEAMYLYHKSTHSQLAVARLSDSGMQSWAMFNAYHSALLGAKAIMSMLGLTFPKINGVDALVDIFPISEKIKNGKSQRRESLTTSDKFSSFNCMLMPNQLQQNQVWEALQRVLRMTNNAFTDNEDILSQLQDLPWEKITTPRNAFLYKPSHWTILSDIDKDIISPDWEKLASPNLDISSDGFLFKLSFAVHILLSWLINDLAAVSNLIGEQKSLSRWPQNANTEQWVAWAQFNGGRPLPVDR